MIFQNYETLKESINGNGAGKRSATESAVCGRSYIDEAGSVLAVRVREHRDILKRDFYKIEN
jgi:hypothetical protein